MIFIPPLLRFVWSNEQLQSSSNNNENNEIEQEISLSKGLQCNLSQNVADKSVAASVFTKYYADKVTSIEVRYDISAVENSSLLSNVPLFAELIKLKEIDNANYEKNGTEEIISFDENISNEPKLQQYSKNMNIQKIYYETLGFTCNIRAY